MTSTDSGTDGDSAEVQSYFQAIEKFFIELRGAPLLLSPADWQVARRWHEQGIPLEVVRRSLEQVFARRRERQQRRKIQSLRYCAPAVEAAWAEIRELTAAGRRLESPPLQVEARLASLAEALPEDLPGRAGWVEALRSLSGETEEVEGALQRLDAQLLAAADESLDEDKRREVDAAVERVLTFLGDRLSAPELAASREQLRRQALRRTLELPVLSLFSPVAEGDSR